MDYLNVRFPPIPDIILKSDNPVMTGAQRALTATTILVFSMAMLALLMTSLRFRVPETEVHVSNASVEVLASRESATAYFVLRTNNDPTKLVEISSPEAKVVELRASGPGTSQKIRLGETTFSPDQPLTFSRGGKHAVLRDLSPSVEPGEEILMTFHVEPAEPLTVRVVVRQAD